MKSEAFRTTLQQLPIEKRRRIRQIRDKRAQRQSIAGLKLLELGIKQLKVRNFHLKKLQFFLSNMTKVAKPSARCAKASFVHFSISHSDNCICCVISTHKHVGIDVEKIRPLAANIVSKYQLGLNNLSPINAWTQKEAVFKVYGEKTLSSLKQIQLEGNQAQFDNQRYYVNSFKLDKNYQMSVASLQPNTKIKIKRVYF